MEPTILRSYKLTQSEIDAVRSLAHTLTDGNLSRTVGLLIRRAALDAGLMKPDHLGIPHKNHADETGKPRCNPNTPRGICPVCYPKEETQ